MLLPVVAVIGGLVLLVWSAGRFVDGAATTARHLGMPSLLIGMVVVGFGTSAPELVVSVLAAMQGNPGIALGNAYGSNITNIGLILGITALLSPITVHSQALRKELPLLTLVTALSAWLLWDGAIDRIDASLLVGVFAVLMAWTVWQGLAGRDDALGQEMAQELDLRGGSLSRALVALVAGLVLLIVSSRILVWGAVQIALEFGLSDLIIGLTIIAVGTSLPELASAVIATRRGEHDLALGNVLGSNLFNTLAVVGLAGLIDPISVAPEVLSRDVLVMGLLTLSLFALGYGFRGPGRVNRVEGAGLVAAYLGYGGYLIATAVVQSA